MANTIFMIHGMWGGAWCWENYQPLFEGKGYRCVVPTLPYHDMDPTEEPDERLGTTSLLEYVDVLEMEIRKLETKPILMGHSMGGLLAQMLASRGVGKAVVLLTPASPAGIMAIRPSAVRSFWSVMTKWGFWRKPMRQTFEENAYAVLHRLPAEEQREMYDRFVPESGRTLFEIACWPFDAKKASVVDESKVTCPVLVVAGSQDRMTPASVVRKVAQKYKSVATYQEFPDLGHLVIGEPGWEAVANYVLEWLEPFRKNTENLVNSTPSRNT